MDDALAEARAPPPPAQAAAPGAIAGASPLGAGAAAAALAPGSAGGKAGRGKKGDGFISYMESKLADKPQTRFADKVDNSNAPFHPRLDHLVAAGLIDAAAAEAAAGGGAHPLAARLEALRYGAWQLAAPPPEPRPPRAFEDTPFEFVDTPPALAAAVQARVPAAASAHARRTCRCRALVPALRPADAARTRPRSQPPYSAWLRPRR